MDPYLPPGFDLGRLLFDQANKELRPALFLRARTVIKAYDKALEDPRAVLPTYLHAAIEALR